MSRYSSLEDARLNLPKSLSGELETCPIYGWRKAFLTTVSTLAPAQMPVWSPSLPALSSSLYKGSCGAAFPPSLRQCHNFSLIFLISTLFGSFNSEVVEQGVLSTLQDGSQSLSAVTDWRDLCWQKESCVWYLMALGMGSLLSLCMVLACVERDV